MNHITKHTKAPMYKPRPMPRPKIQRYTIVDGEFRDIDRHTRRLQIIGMTFATVLLAMAGLLLVYGILLHG